MKTVNSERPVTELCFGQWHSTRECAPPDNCDMSISFINITKRRDYDKISVQYSQIRKLHPYNLCHHTKLQSQVGERDYISRHMTTPLHPVSKQQTTRDTAQSVE